MTRKELRLARKVMRAVKAKERGKEGYAEADRLVQELAAELEPGQSIPLDASGRRAILKDQFAKPVAWKTVGVRRWSLRSSADSRDRESTERKMED